jgi:O-antigen ligase/Flp pilus assembly protein TadD
VTASPSALERGRPLGDAADGSPGGHTLAGGTAAGARSLAPGEVARQAGAPAVAGGWGWAVADPPASGPTGGPAALGARALRLLGSTWATTIGCAAALCAIAFVGGGGLELGSATAVEMSVTIAAGVILAAAILLGALEGGSRRPMYGLTPALLLTAFAVLTAMSIGWSVQPDAAWQEAGRIFAYSALFATAVALARALPGGWRSIAGGVTLACVVVSTYGLLTKVFPGTLDATDTYSRLQQPYGYWIAMGLTAAMGVIGCLWLGARRDGHALWRALAYPAMGIELATLMLTYSRGPLAALAVGLVVWFAIVPLRLRGGAVLLVAAVGAAPAVVYDFSSQALSNEGMALAARSSAGRQLGVLLAAMVLALALAGIAICFLTGRAAPSPRARRAGGAVLLALPALAVLAILVGLAASQRGPTGTISHAFETLTNPNSAVPANTPGRLTAVASVRARYWKEALQIWQGHPLLGAGGEGYATARLRYRTETLDVRHAHGFVVQTLADLGLAGLAVMIALLVAWAVAAARPVRPLRLRLPYGPERIALLSLLVIVVVFGVHSIADWTWYVPADACIALLCAGWLAGRGPLPAAPASAERAGRRPGGRLGERLRAVSPARAALAATTLAVALLAAFTQWQPERAVGSAEQALALTGRNDAAALVSARRAVAQDPLSDYALRVLAFVEQSSGQSAAAEAALRRAVRLQPANPEAWAALGEHDLAAGEVSDALGELRAAVYLNPEAVAPEATIAQSPELLGLRDAYLQALRASARPAATSVPASARAQRPGARRLRRARLTARQRRQSLSHSRIAPR